MKQKILASGSDLARGSGGVEPDGACYPQPSSPVAIHWTPEAESNSFRLASFGQMAEKGESQCP